MYFNLFISFHDPKALQNVRFNMKGNERKDNKRRVAYGMGREGVRDIVDMKYGELCVLLCCHLCNNNKK